MNEPIPLGVTIFVGSSFARQNVSEIAEGFLQGFVINLFVEVFDEYIPDTRFSQTGVSLGPHDPANLPFDLGVAHRFEGFFSVRNIVKVDVGVSKRSPGYSVPANSDRSNWTNAVEELKELSFSDIWMEVTHIE